MVLRTPLAAAAATVFFLGACEGEQGTREIDALRETVGALQTTQAGTAPVQPSGTASPTVQRTAEACSLERVQNAMGAVVYIETPNATGSGFFITPTTIITNRHVVGYWRSVRIETASGTVLQGSVTGLSDREDLAVIETTTSGPGTLTWGEGVGEPWGSCLRHRLSSRYPGLPCAHERHCLAY